MSSARSNVKQHLRIVALAVYGNDIVVGEGCASLHSYPDHGVAGPADTCTA